MKIVGNSTTINFSLKWVKSGMISFLVSLLICFFLWNVFFRTEPSKPFLPNMMLCVSFRTMLLFHAFQCLDFEPLQHSLAPTPSLFPKCKQRLPLHPHTWRESKDSQRQFPRKKTNRRMFASPLIFLIGDLTLHWKDCCVPVIAPSRVNDKESYI